MYTVLLVVDDSTLCSVIADLLVGEGCTVMQTTRGADAQRLAVAHQPDVILLDVGLPDAEGRAILDHLKSRPLSQTIPVVVVSWRPIGPTDPLLRKVARVLPKPFALDDLLVAVGEGAGRARALPPVPGRVRSRGAGE